MASVLKTKSHCAPVFVSYFLFWGGSLLFLTLRLFYEARTYWKQAETTALNSSTKLSVDVVVSHVCVCVC